MRSYLAPLFFVLSLLFYFNPDLALAGPPIEIRFSAAIVLTQSNFQHNQPFESKIESAGYDIIWRGRIFGTAFQNGGPIVLMGKGQTKNNYKIGGGSCTGTLSVAPEYASLQPAIWQNNGTVKMSITLPHLAANTGLHAMIMDKNQPEQSTCRTANGQLFSAVCYTPNPVDCYTLDGSISPGFVSPGGDATKLGKFFNHNQDAYFEFNDNSPNTSIPFSYTATQHVFDSNGFETDFIKIVWAGYLTISTSVGKSNPGPFDPFNFFEFDPNTLSGPPTDPIIPDNPFKGSKDPGFDVSEVTGWMKDLGKSAQNFIKGLQGIFGKAKTAAASLEVNGTGGSLGTYDHDTGAAILSAFNAPPASGILQIALKTKSKKAAKGFVLKVPKKAIKNQITAKQPVGLNFVLDKAARKVLEKGQASKVFFSVKFTPATGKKTIEKRFKFGLAKRK